MSSCQFSVQTALTGDLYLVRYVYGMLFHVLLGRTFVFGLRAKNL